MTIRSVFNHKKIIATAALCSLGILFLATQSSVVKEANEASLVEPPKTDQVAEKSISTSQLIEKAASKHIKADESIKSYPNVTPSRLEKPFSPTLEGTDIDGQIRVGDDGTIVLDLAVKDFFDYFLSAVGEVTPELALDELLSVINESLPAENAAEAQALLENYLAYKQDAVNLMSQPMLPRDQQTPEYQLQIMEDSLTQLRELRRMHMPAEQVEAFFGLEESYEDYTIAAVRIQFDDTMSEPEKAQMLEYHRSQLPDPIRKTEVQVASDNKKNTEIHQTLESGDQAVLVSKLEDHGYDELQKKQVLAHTRRQAAFDQRYKAYTSEKASRLAGVTNPEEKKKILTRLQNEYFSTEQEITQAKVRDLRS